MADAKCKQRNSNSKLYLISNFSYTYLSFWLHGSEPLSFLLDFEVLRQAWGNQSPGESLISEEFLTKLHPFSF